MCPISSYVVLLNQDDKETRGKLMAAITEHNMAPLYTSVCKDLKWQVDGNLLAKMEENNKEKLATLEAAIADATENLGESETREALLKKAEFFAQVKLGLTVKISYSIGKYCQVVFFYRLVTRMPLLRL